MTGVTRRFLTGVEGEPAGNDTTWSAAQVGPRRVGACLGGQDDGASGGRRGVGNGSIHQWKRGWWAMLDLSNSLFFVAKTMSLEVKGEKTSVEQRCQIMCEVSSTSSLVATDQSTGR